MTIQEAIGRAMRREDLEASEAEAAMGQIMSGEATQAQIGAFLAALGTKGETAEEITGCTRAMRRNATAVRPRSSELVDTCGTGGDGACTFNISTTAALVAAAAGLKVAKHGNRSISSRCGSADLFAALGVRLDLPPERVAACVDEVGIGFLYAPALHPAMKHAMGPRRELGVRTIFNLLGPLTNPAGAAVQVLGVFDCRLTETLAHVLRALGSRTAYVVHGAGGLDELSTTGPNQVSELRRGAVRTFTLEPLDLGLPRSRLADLQGGDAATNAALTRAVLQGERGPRRDVVLLNAAAALAAAELADALADGLQLAARAIDSGRALAVLDHLVAFTNEGA
jgi:anthranilate phosphoribosyltransferase